MLPSHAVGVRYCLSCRSRVQCVRVLLAHTFCTRNGRTLSQTILFLRALQGTQYDISNKLIDCSHVTLKIES